MGYRSQVGFVLDKTATKEMQAAMEKSDKLHDLVEVDLEAVVVNGEMGGMVDDIKWYSATDEAVISFENILHDTEGEFLFICIGEEVGDVTMLGSYYNNPFNLGFHQMLEFEKPE